MVLHAGPASHHRRATGTTLVDANGVRFPLSDDSNGTEEELMFLKVQRGTQSEPPMRDFQSLVGSQLWLARCTCPDLCFAVHKATRRTHKPTISDWKLAKRVARYLKATKQLKLVMKTRAKGDKLSAASWSDSDFAADKTDMKHWRSHQVGWSRHPVDLQKQAGVSLSTTEAEFTSASHVGRELLGIRELLQEIGQEVHDPMPMFMDNQAAIRQLEAEDSISSAKHVDVRIKFICDYTKRDIVKPRYIESKFMIDGLLTKALPAPRLTE